MQNSIYQEMLDRKARGQKSFILLIDPDKFDEQIGHTLHQQNAFAQADFLFVGGSLINGSNINGTILQIKSYTDKPVIIFPGSNMHIDLAADGILFLSLISGRNPEFLIGQHIVAAPFLKRSRLEVLATGYMLIEGGQATTVSYISNTSPIPHDKPEVAACTAIAGEMLGLKLIYADAGSGAQKSISKKMIHSLRKAIDIPLIIGGGIRTAAKAQEILEAGADTIVVGNAAEKDPSLISQIGKVVAKLNNRSA
ncbi:MAG: geranylgeranylglyceryl/heptaprenylglyceryl phosphate synthase [Bacteroidota bacterium]